MTSIHNLLRLLESSSKHIIYAAKINEKISKVNVAWHLDHMIKVIIGVSNQLLQSEPSNYKSNFNWSRSVLFTLGFIPRGKGKSPKAVLPPEVIRVDDITSQIAEATALLVRLKKLSANANFKHSIFGVLNKSQTIRFMEIHTKHHLKIVGDILK